jgi:CO/xanthine dehydrogenase Mo-binding subunit
VVHDEGRLINPLLVDANVQGALAQGIGGALYEDLRYDEAGQFLTGTFMDYTIPTAVDLPDFELAAQETPSPLFPLGTKGVGESGIACPLGALCGAVDDALVHLNVGITQLPLTPFRVWSAIRAARPVGASQ